MYQEEPLLARLRQPLNNISMAAQNIELYLESLGLCDANVTSMVEIITRNITRMNDDLTEALSDEGTLPTPGPTATLLSPQASDPAPASVSSGPGTGRAPSTRPKHPARSARKALVEAAVGELLDWNLLAYRNEQGDPHPDEVDPRFGVALRDYMSAHTGIERAHSAWKAGRDPRIRYYLSLSGGGFLAL